jgi:DNA topoisomerase-3
VPGDYARWPRLAPTAAACAGELPALHLHRASEGQEPAASRSGKSAAGRTFELGRGRALLRDKKIGPLEASAPRPAGPSPRDRAQVHDEDKNWKLEFDFGDDKNAAETGEIVDFSGQSPLGPARSAARRVFEYGKNYVCEKSVPTAAQPTPSCDFKSGRSSCSSRSSASR